MLFCENPSLDLQNHQKPLIFAPLGGKLQQLRLLRFWWYGYGSTFIFPGELRKINGRYAKKINDYISFKISASYLSAYEWEFISEDEWKNHKFAWIGSPDRTVDKKDNNPWNSSFTLSDDQIASWETIENIIKNVNANAPVKIIASNKSEDEIITMFKEIIAEVKKIDLKQKIENLENKVSISLDESSYSELLSLRNQLKEG